MPYNQDCDLFLGIDEGYRNPNVTLWIQPDLNGERVEVLFAHYQTYRTPDENAKIALEIHQKRGYGALTGGWGDPSAPATLRAYSLVFGVEILAPRILVVTQGHEIVREWLRLAKQTQGRKGLVFSQECPRELFNELIPYAKHEPGTGRHHGPDGVRYFFCGWPGA